MSTAKKTPAVRFESPDIRKAENELAAIDMAQRAAENAGYDAVVGAFGTHDVFGNASAVSITRRGHVYRMHDREDDWHELPPVPGTKAREFYDARKRLRDKVDTLKRALGREADDDAE